MNGTDVNKGSQQAVVTDGRMIRPDGKPFSVGFSKEHPTQPHLAYGFDNDLLVPFTRYFDAICYTDYFIQSEEHGLLVPCPRVAPFSNCNILFEAMSDPTNENYTLYRQFVDWWSDAIARSILTAGLENGIFFNLAGYSKERVAAVIRRYNRLLESVDARALEYDFLKSYDPTGKYTIVPHLSMNTKWTDEERESIGCLEEDLYPGFTDWDLGFIMRDERILAKTKFYFVNTPAELTEKHPVTPLSREELLERFGIEIVVE